MFGQTTFPFAIYGNQALIPVHQHGNTLSVSAGGTLKNNTYKWFKVGQAGNTSIKGDSVFHPLTNGRYFTTVTNSVATQLTLKSDTIKYTMSATLSAPAIASSEDASQQDKTTLLLAYPNPAKKGAGWLSKAHFALDQGPVLLMIENYRSGLIWRLMRGCESLVRGLRRAGFASGWLPSETTGRGV